MKTSLIFSITVELFVGVWSYFLSRISITPQIDFDDEMWKMSTTTNEGDQIVTCDRMCSSESEQIHTYYFID